MSDKKEVKAIIQYADCRTYAKWAYDAASQDGHDVFLYMPDGAHVEAVVDSRGTIYDVELSDISVNGSTIVLTHKLKKTQASSGWKEAAFSSGSAFYPGIFFNMSILSRTGQDSIDAYGVDDTISQLESLGYQIVCTMK